MANKRLAELNELLANQVATVDLFLIGDESIPESKRITAANLQSYVLNGTASYATNGLSCSYSSQSLSASYAPNISASYAKSASWASLTISSSYASASLSASYALSSSFALRAISASYSLTSSVQLTISSANATYAQSASYLIYTPGFNNGRILLANTASFVATASRAVSASIADTASYINSSNIDGAVTLASNATFAYNATYATTAVNGVYTKTSLLSSITQSRTGISAITPDSASGLVMTIVASHPNPTYLLNMSAVVGGVSGIGLWRSSSFDPVGGTPLIQTIAVVSASLSNVHVVSATYVDSPQFVVAGNTLYYFGVVYNPNGYYYMNMSFDETNFGTSSISAIEF